MAAPRNFIAAWLLMALPCAAQFTPAFYPPTNAPIRTYDGTNYTFAKDVWWSELAAATLERMAVVGEYDAGLAEPPIREPSWDNEVCALVKANLLDISSEFLDLRYTNSAGVFTNFYDVTGASYSNRFWTKSNLLAFCSLPTNFFEYTPARFLGPNGLTNGSTNIMSGYSTAHYAWEGVYRVVKALDYYQPRSAWREIGVIESATASGNAPTAQTNVCGGAYFPIPSPWTTWAPTNYTTNINIATGADPFLGSSGLIQINQAADGTAHEEFPLTNAASWWAVNYSYNTPDTINPGAWLQHRTFSAAHPTNILDGQSFNRPDGYYVDAATTTYYAAAHAKWGAADYYFEIPPATATNDLFYLADRGAWPVVLWTTNYIAVSTSAIFQSVASSLITVADVTQNPPSTNFIKSGYSVIPFRDVDGGFGWGHPGLQFYFDYEPSPSFDWTEETDPCSPSDYLANGWSSRYTQYGFENLVAVRPEWRYRADL